MRASSGSAGRQRDATDDGQREEQRAPGAGGEHPGQLVRGQQVEQRRGDDEARAGELARRQAGDVGPPRLEGDPGRPGSATASSSRSASRSCTTQCCGPGSRGASQRPIAPLPPPRSWTTRGPAASRCRAETLGELGRARRRVGRLAQDEPLRADPDALRAHRAAPASTPARTDVVAGHPRSDARRSRAARRSRPRSRRRRASAAARRRGPPGRRAGPAAPAGCRRRRARGPRSRRRPRRRGPAGRGPAPR